MSKVVFIVLLLTINFLGCVPASPPECPEASLLEEKGSVFLLGHHFAVTPYLNEVIQNAGIDKSGYALIISDAIVSDTGKFTALLRALNYYKIFAVHNVHFEKGKEPAKEDEIKIKHAGLIFLIITDQQARADFLDHPTMVQLVKHAHSNGATIAGIAYGADLTGDYFVVDSDTTSDEIVFKQGLQFLNGYVVGKSGAYQQVGKELLNNLQQHELVFVGLSPHDGLKLCGNELLILEKRGLEVITSKNGKEAGNLSKGDLISPEK
jgi:hypothetical protein